MAVAVAVAVVLAAQHFPHEVDDWEGLPSNSRMWMAWKTTFRLAHLKLQHQLLALGGGDLLGWAHGVLPEAAPTIGRLKKAFDSLALAATNNMAILQQLTAANLALTTTVTTLTATDKKLVDAAARAKGGGTPAVTPMTPGRGVRPRGPCSLATTAGRMGINATNTTPVPPAATWLWAIAMMPQL